MRLIWVTQYRKSSNVILRFVHGRKPAIRCAVHEGPVKDVSDISAFLRMQDSAAVNLIYLPQNKKAPTPDKEWLRPSGIMDGRSVPWTS
jgi:hypothetical protein